ncbi:MAG: TAXI family TRAP transporter solute-binding subunit [Rhizobiaceae bacterium]
MAHTLIRKFGYVAAAAMMLACAPVSAKELNLTLAGASPGGLWTLLGAGLESALKANEPGSTVTYQTSGGGFANVAQVSQGRVEIGLVHDAELSIAVAGGKPFKAPVTNLRMIGYLYDWAPMQFIAHKSFTDKYNIESIANIATNKAPARVTVNRAGNITGLVAVAMLEAVGASEENIKQWGGAVVRAGSKEQANLMANGRVDLFSNGIFVKHSSIRKLQDALDIKLLTIPENVRKKVGAEFGIGSFTIAANTYENQPKNIKTLALGAVLVASDAMSEEDAYTLTKAMIENIKKIQAVHPAMAALSHELMSRKTAVPFHVGAVRAYREAQLME